MKKIDRFLGCLVGGALGDALGYPIEFLTMNEICRMYGSSGIKAPRIYKYTDTAHISDDTQMTLFTANGILLAHNEGLELSDALWLAYQRWYYTQMRRVEDMTVLTQRPGDPLPYIMFQRDLYADRASGSTCLMELGGGRRGTPENPFNSSKGCGGCILCR